MLRVFVVMFMAISPHAVKLAPSEPPAPGVCGREPPHQSLTSFFRSLNQTGGINHGVLREAFNDGYIGLKVKIRNGKVCEELKNSSWKEGINRRWQWWYKPFFQKALEGTNLPDMDIILSLNDGAPGGKGVMKVEGRAGQDFLAVPRSLVDEDIQQAASDWTQAGLKCKNRTKKIVFRGGITGSDFNLSDVRSGTVKSMRYKVIAHQAQARPDIFDAGFVNVDPGQTDNAEGGRQVLE
jgi:hypothetical protein